ncbi:VACUOLAR MEMBRANE PROTEIN YPL162C [Ceraceosorus bombacis]|uniref:VACUOLAR MEMBRANE PROTEIN YPL162C n=1 Tax=Ceraceosorus bombacis TaxID=401625 RepID=A0A0P1BN75_9BASI|nr:VACUOLAR MEMBRANE PROTEIN YPL162C [Ceraceosorus bombacis]
MGVIVVGSLVFKRRRERPMRPWKIWMLDVTKQMLGQGFVHSLNVFLSDWTSHHGTDRTNPCALYVLNIGVDTTLGVGFIYLAMRFLTHFLTDVAGIEGCVSGVYSAAPIVTALPPPSPSGSTSGRPRLPRSRTRRRYRRGASQHAQRPRLSFWARQLAMYLFAMLLMKLAVLFLFSLLPFLVDLADDILALFGGHKRAELLFSLAIFPIIMNVLQFWLIDSLLRHDPVKSKYAADPDGHVGGASEATGHEGRPSEASEYFDGDSLDIERGGGRNSNNSGGMYRQARNQSEAHLVGDASESEDDEQSNDRRQRSSTTDAHAYPPSLNGSAAGSRAGSPRNDLRGDAEDAWDAWDDIDGAPATAAAMGTSTTAEDKKRSSNDVKLAMTSPGASSPPADPKRRD